MRPKEALLRKLLSSGNRWARRSGPMAAAIGLNVLMVAGFAAASVGRPGPKSPMARPTEPIAVTLVLADFIPPPQQRPRPRSMTPAPAGENDASITRKRKPKGVVTPMLEIDPVPDALPAGSAAASLEPDGAPAGLRSLLQKPEPCGPTSERNLRVDCKGPYAKLAPPVDDWRLPDLKYYKARFGEVIGVEEERLRFLKSLALMGKPAGAQDPMGQ